MNEALEQATYHAWFTHHNADGWITLAKKENGSFRQYHYKPEELAEQLSAWVGEDVYFSQNTFYKPFRMIENVRQLRTLYVDVDCYLLNYDPNWVLGKIDLELIHDGKMPEPNLVIFSGRGLVCIWMIDPVPSQALPLWQSVQQYFCKLLETVGGDSKATDAARIFRVAGSVNSKNGERVHVAYNHDYRYALRDIQHEYLPDLKPKKKKGRPPKIAQLHNIHRLHYARFHDLIVLVRMRAFDIHGMRETTLFLYRYWLCCYLSDSDEALVQTLSFNNELRDPIPEREVIRATKSAEKAWKARSDQKANEQARTAGYPGAGYNLSNKKIIDWLAITKDEQQQLQTIISGHEKRRRKRERDQSYQASKRRERGAVSREMYLQKQQDITADKLFLLEQAIERHPDATQAELGELLNVSQRYISTLWEKL